MSPRCGAHVVASDGSGGKFSIPGCEALGCSPERAGKNVKEIFPLFATCCRIAGRRGLFFHAGP